mgnify:FL=1
MVAKQSETQETNADQAQETKPVRNERRYFYPRYKNADGSEGVTVVAETRKEADNKLKELEKEAKDD